MRPIFIRKHTAALATATVLNATLLAAFDAGAACVVPPFSTPVEAQLQYLPQCQHDPVYLAQIGRLLNAQKRYGEALDHLERALMFDSESAEIQLDYALALAGEGDWLSAVALLDTLLAQTALPASIRLAVQQAKDRGTMPSTPPALTASTLRFSAQLRAGTDNNLLGSPRLDQLTISLPNEVLTLPLDGTMQPRSGAYHRTDARVEWGFGKTAHGVWELSANMSQRRSPDVPEADSHQDDFSLEYAPHSQPDHPLAPYVFLTRSTFNAVRGTQFTQWGIGGGVQTPIGECSLRWGGEWQDRSIVSNPLLSGLYAGTSVSWRCNKHWQWAFKVGKDRPLNPERPGGLQHIASLRGLFLKGNWLWDNEFSHTHDSTGYSPLLDYDAARSTNRFSTRLEYHIPIGAHWLAALGVEWSRQDSNLALFQVQNWGTYASLRWVW